MHLLAQQPAGWQAPSRPWTTSCARPSWGCAALAAAPSDVPHGRARRARAQHSHVLRLAESCAARTSSRRRPARRRARKCCAPAAVPRPLLRTGPPTPRLEPPVVRSLLRLQRARARLSGAAHHHRRRLRGAGEAGAARGGVAAPARASRLRRRRDTALPRRTERAPRRTRCTPSRKSCTGRATNRSSMARWRPAAGRPAVQPPSWWGRGQAARERRTRALAAAAAAAALPLPRNSAAATVRPTPPPQITLRPPTSFFTSLVRLPHARAQS